MAIVLVKVKVNLDYVFFSFSNNISRSLTNFSFLHVGMHLLSYLSVKLEHNPDFCLGRRKCVGFIDKKNTLHKSCPDEFYMKIKYLGLAFNIDEKHII